MVCTGWHLQDKWQKTRKKVIERFVLIDKATNRLKHQVSYNQSIGVPYQYSLFIPVMAVHVTKPMGTRLKKTL